jgi:hypothetical protein
MTMVDSERHSSHRLWRLRKRDKYVDAELRGVDGDVVEIRFLLNGERTYKRQWPTRGEALAEAAERRAELERQGWMEHW